LLIEDYVWLNPDTGETKCWLNNLPNAWSPAGTNNSIIASGAGRAAQIYLAVRPETQNLLLYSTNSD